MYHDYINSYLEEVQEIAGKLDREQINHAIEILKDVRDNRGRLFILGVGGGAGHASHAVNDFRKLTNIEKSVGAKIVGVVGRDGGHTAKVADACILVPVVNPENVTPHTEAFQAVVWHIIVSHPKFQSQKGKWESVQGKPEK
jgi:phosphoheptose isomerase